MSFLQQLRVTFVYRHGFSGTIVIASVLTLSHQVLSAILRPRDRAMPL
jgi:hypothetical protein